MIEHCFSALILVGTKVSKMFDVQEERIGIIIAKQEKSL